MSYARALARYVMFRLPSLPVMAMAFFTGLTRTFEDILEHSREPDYASHMMTPAEINSLLIVAAIYAFLLLSYGLGYWLPMLLTRQKTALHDYVSGTRVYRRISKNVPVSGPPTAPGEP